MVASLQSRRDTLEAMLRDKTLELKQLCIQEAELTGILPPETPIAPGERPPIFSRKVDTRCMNHLNANIDNRWFQRESQVSVDSTNGFHAYNSVRRTAKPEYQYNHNLQSSEPELNHIFKQIHINKAQPSYVHHAYRPTSSGNWNRNQWYRHSVSQIHHNADGYDFPNLHKQNLQHSRAPASNLRSHSYATLPKGSRFVSQYNSLNRGQRSSHSSNGCTNFSGAHLYAVPPPFNHVSSETLASYNGHNNSTLPVAATRHRSVSISSPIRLDTRYTAFESHQTYPEPNLCASTNGAKNSSCQSLNLYSIPEKGPCQFHCNSLGRKKREKEWRETSLDAADSTKNRQLPHSSIRTPNIPESASFQRLLSRHRMHSFSSPLQSTSDFTTASFSRGESKSPAELAVQMESNVPLESPKNHMVVEAGKWKPYRETTKPFEMSDFYKYSTKFKKNKQ